MIQFPVAYVLSKHTVLQADGLWWSFPVTNILVALVSLGWFARGSWKEKRLTEEDREAVKVTDEVIIEEGLR
jgi:Na+-driven multidrug efflux pump